MPESRPRAIEDCGPLVDASRECAISDQVMMPMSSLDSNTLVPEDELQATLAEIEKMSAEEAATIPSLDDGNPDADEAAADEPPDQGQASASTESDDSAGAPQADEAPESSTSLGDNELKAALAEVETISPNSAPPSPRRSSPLDGDSAESDEGGPSKPVVEEARTEAEPDEATPPEDASANPAPSDQKQFRFRIGENADGEAPAEDQSAPERDEVVTGHAARPVAPLAKRVYRTLDRALDALNRPLARLGPGARALVGWVALVTLVVSMLAALLLPRVFPHRDAITFLQEKHAQLDAPPPDKTQDPAP